MASKKRARLSVVMGFRDWGLERLDLALRAHRLATVADDLELIVVDFGSRCGEAVYDTAKRWDASVCRVEARGRWNRSHCLNVGIRAAHAHRVLTTDADILFGPRTVELILDAVSHDNDFFLVQCHDLPQLAPRELADLDFGFFARSAELRPPWGMGGCACFRKALAFEIRGFDERMEWWGSEDNDFVQRAMQHGEEVRWLDHPNVRCYHAWHPKVTDVHAKDEQFQAVVNHNRGLVANDTTVIRNAYPWGAAAPARPTMSACIITRNRAHLIGDTIESLLHQTWQDFEIVIVDDGSDDRTAEVVQGYCDSRIRYIRKKHEGIPAARNVAVSEARGDYICIVDDDDIQLPDRIERHLCAVEDGYVGSYGGWIDFDEETRQIIHNPGRSYSLEALLYASKVLTHGALCILREVLHSHRYRRDLLYGSDFDLALRIAASGYKLKHVGAYLILRRLHHDAVTRLNSPSQKRTGQNAVRRMVAALTPDEARHVQEIARQSSPLNLPDPLQDASLALRLPPSMARLLATAAAHSRQGEAPDSGIGRRRLLERPQQRAARLEIGPFGSVKQAELHLRRLKDATGKELAIEPRRRGATETVFFVAWPWSLDGETWEDHDRIEREYRYPSEVVIKDSNELVAPSSNGAPPKAFERALLSTPTRRSLRGIAEALFPPGSFVLVISKGDDSLLDLGPVCGSHFPQTEEGAYAGFHPADSAEAIASLETLRAKGANYLLVPVSSFWWLEHYDGFREHLEKQYRMIHYEESLCLIYALDNRSPVGRDGLKKQLWIPVRAGGTSTATT